MQPFDEFMTDSQGLLLKAAYVVTGDHQLAQDVVQATFIRLWERWDRISSMDNPQAYASRVLHSQIANWYRLKRVRREIPLAVLPESTADSKDGATELAVDLARALITLPPRQRSVLVRDISKT